MKVRILGKLLLATTALVSTPALAQTTSGAVEEVVVTATGVTRQQLAGGLMVVQEAPKGISTVTQDFIQKQDPASDVFQNMKYLPGANVATADPYNLNQAVIAVRGLEGGQLGFTLEGSPLNVECCWSVFPGEWIDNENIGRIDLIQGAQSLATAAMNASGGTSNIEVHEPTHSRGGLFDASIGSHNAYRGFLRLETGDIGSTGIRAFLSYSHIKADHFRGPGTDDKDTINFGAVKDFSNGSRIKLVATYAEIVRDTYKNPTLTQWNISGVKGAQTNYNGVPASATDTNYYKLLKNPWRNLITSAPALIKVSDAVSLDITPYFYYGYGATGSAAVLNENQVNWGQRPVPIDLNGNGTTTDTGVLVYSPTYEETERAGIVADVNYTTGANNFVAGFWYQYAHDELWKFYSRVNSDGSPVSYRGYNGQYLAPDGSQLRPYDNDVHDRFGALFIGDTIKLDKLTINLGLKQLFVEREGINRVPSSWVYTDPQRSKLLPTASISYQVNPENQVFADVGEGFRALPDTALFPRYAANSAPGVTSAAVTTNANPHQPSETSVSEEVGWRYHGSLVNASVTAYHYSFKNRQISAQVCDPGCVTQPINGGDQSAYGVDFEVGTKPWNHIRPYFSAAYLNTSIDSNIPVAGDYLPTDGKEGVRSPHWQAALALDYDDGTFFGNISGKYTGSQFSTFMNDEKIPSFTTADMVLGVRMQELGAIKKPELRLNLLNITGEKYLSGVANPTTNAAATRGLNGATIAASAPSYYIASGFTAILTLAASF